jgi:hypothetical protein
VKVIFAKLYYYPLFTFAAIAVTLEDQILRGKIRAIQLRVYSFSFLKPLGIFGDFFIPEALFIWDYGLICRGID